MIVATAIALLLSVIAILVALWALWYAKRQTELMEREETQRQQERESAVEWEPKYLDAVGAVLNILRKQAQATFGGVYFFVFPDEDLRRAIETYLIDADFNHRQFSPRRATAEQLLLPAAQDTIRSVLECVTRFKQTDPGNAKRLGL